MTSAPNERSEQEVFDELEAVCAAPGYVHVLAFLSLRDNMVSHDGHMTGEDMAASYAPDRTVRTEFSTLLGLMMKHPVDFSVPAPPEMQALIDRTQTLLAELHDRLRKPMMDAIVEGLERKQAGLPVDEATVFARGDVLREPIFLWRGLRLQLPVSGLRARTLREGRSVAARQEGFRDRRGSRRRTHTRRPHEPQGGRDCPKVRAFRPFGMDSSSWLQLHARRDCRGGQDRASRGRSRPRRLHRARAADKRGLQVAR